MEIITGRIDRESILETLRPGNESYEHFILKQVGKKWLYDKGLRHIGTEVYVNSERESPYGKKTTVDVVGVDYKKVRVYEPGLNKMLNDWENAGKVDRLVAETIREHPESFGDIMGSRGGMGEEKKRKLVDLIKEEGYSVEEFERKVRRDRDNYTLYTIEAKASESDFKNGFSVAGDYSYVIVPEGVVRKDLVPPGVGLIEVDIDKVRSGGSYRKAVTMGKRVRHSIDEKYIGEDGKVNEIYRKYEMREIIDRIHKRNVNENHYWNPHIR